MQPPPSRHEHPQLAADAVIVGAGPAGLACALHLARLLETRGLPKDNIYVLEKGRGLGAHQLSGAAMDPSGLAALEPGFASDPELGAIPVTDDALFWLTKKHALRSPLTPPPLRNRGNYIVSLNRLAQWLGQKVEAAGVNVFTGFAGRELLFDGSRLLGVRTGDKGVGRDGQLRANFQPGYDLLAPVIVLAEGSRGSLTCQLCDRLQLGSANPQVYSLGIKEVWELPAASGGQPRFAAGRVAHTLGWPLGRQRYGGGWIYGLGQHRVSIGLMTALEYRDPATDPHNLFQQFKTHPWLARLLEGGELLRYGAKTTPMGGWYSLPPTAGDEWLLIGDSAGFVNSQRLKGIHLAICSGMLAAEAVVAKLTGAASLRSFAREMAASSLHDELWPVRNFHQGFARGLESGLLHAAAQSLTGGRGLHARYPLEAGRQRLLPVQQLGPPPFELQPDARLTFDKLTDVYHSGTRHEEDQPSHLQIADYELCNTRCRREFGNPCVSYCPAHVYEMIAGADGQPRLHLNPSNCVHCKACDIMDPYVNITWVPPEGGGGPEYSGM